MKELDVIFAGLSDEGMLREVLRITQGATPPMARIEAIAFDIKTYLDWKGAQGCFAS
jgi:hypothetical protein